MADQMAEGRIEQRSLLRAERVPGRVTIVVRGGRLAVLGDLRPNPQYAKGGI
jgi:hypothetical protein